MVGVASEFVPCRGGQQRHPLRANACIAAARLVSRLVSGQIPLEPVYPEVIRPGAFVALPLAATPSDYPCKPAMMMRLLITGIAIKPTMRAMLK